jgi:hypothetical protein
MGPTAHHHLQEILLGFRRKINLFFRDFATIGPGETIVNSELALQGNIGNLPAHSYFRASAGLAEAALMDWKPTVRTARTSVARPVPTNPSQPTPVL